MEQYQISAKCAKYKDVLAEYEHYGDLDSVKAFARNVAIRNPGIYGVVVYVYNDSSVVFRCEYNEISL